MRRAIELARKGMGHVSPNPMVGCVIVKDGRIISEGYHEKYGAYHAERNALLRCKEDTEGAEAYVTLEPCPMCAGAAVNARLDAVVYGAADPAAGCLGSKINLFALDFFARPRIVAGVLADECAALLRSFFQERRSAQTDTTEGNTNG